MPLAPLADVTDLPAAWAAHTDAQRAIDVATSAIRDAAGHPISMVTATVAVTGGQSRLLPLPAPVSAVTAVKVDSRDVADYQSLPEGLWRACGWGGPSRVEVSATFGYPTVPPDIVDMCTQLAVAWLTHRSEGGGSTAGLKSVKIDDAAESYTDELAGQVSPVFIPKVTRNWLRARFGGSVAVLETTL